MSRFLLRLKCFLANAREITDLLHMMVPAKIKFNYRDPYVKHTISSESLALQMENKNKILLMNIKNTTRHLKKPWFARTKCREEKSFRATRPWLLLKLWWYTGQNLNSLKKVPIKYLWELKAFCQQFKIWRRKARPSSGLNLINLRPVVILSTRSSWAPSKTQPRFLKPPMF